MCALPIEATAINALLEVKWHSPSLGKAPSDSNTYSVGSIGPHRVVVVHMPGMGKVAAATAAANLRASFQGLKLILLVGICGGAPLGSGKAAAAELLLGDAVVSTGVVQYDLGRRFPGNRFVRKDTPHDNLSRLSFEANALLAKLQTGQGRKELQHSVCQHLGALQQRLGDVAAYPGRKEDRVYKPEYLHKHHDPLECAACAGDVDAVCDEAVEKSCQALGCAQHESNLISRSRAEHLSEPVVHFGLVASGDTVMRSGRDRDEIATRDGVIAFEMEGAGMWEIMRASACLIVKSVCDYADSHKNKKWQGYAAATAAATARALTTCYFFFKDDFEDQKSVTSAISCILHQLFTQKPVLFSAGMRGQLGGDRKWRNPSVGDLWDTLLRVAEDQNAGEIVCVIDALDECESEGRSELARRLLDLYRTKKTPNLRFLVTSRPFGSIRREFQLPDMAELGVVHLSGESEAEVEQISREIDIFIRARVAGIGGRLNLDQDEQELLLHGLLRHTPGHLRAARIGRRSIRQDSFQELQSGRGQETPSDRCGCRKTVDPSRDECGPDHAPVASVLPRA
ncbi:purine and uridine phosphorylase [Trichocladium antarcticum]|uniref:Purine and uridine phosphorylase n=1 Tax=Trichocladium antarcticum TaxID=1450529 RepID=A0AAN6UIN9_9PEZI|nr:purine and uridine phosphorylase [Trichocladium antarcticum]